MKQWRSGSRNTLNARAITKKDMVELVQTMMIRPYAIITLIKWYYGMRSRSHLFSRCGVYRIGRCEVCINTFTRTTRFAGGMNVGILILSDDASKYRVGDYVEGEGVICQPTGDHITYICNVKKITEKELKRWMPLISYRMVFVVPKLPKLSKQIKDEIIIDGFNDKTQSYKREIDALFRWDGRGRVLKMVENLPIPLALSFVKVNNDDIELQRRIADIKYQLPDKYLRATLVYGIKPSRSQVTWPKRKASLPSPNNSVNPMSIGNDC